MKNEQIKILLCADSDKVNLIKKLVSILDPSRTGYLIEGSGTDLNDTANYLVMDEASLKDTANYILLLDGQTAIIEKGKDAVIYDSRLDLKLEDQSELSFFSFGLEDEEADFVAYDLYQDADFVEFDLLYQDNFLYHFHIKDVGTKLRYYLALIVVAVILCIDYRQIEMVLNR